MRERHREARVRHRETETERERQRDTEGLITAAIQGPPRVRRAHSSCLFLHGVTGTGGFTGVASAPGQVTHLQEGGTCVTMSVRLIQLPFPPVLEPVGVIG